jgi:hypothetical protein
MLAFLGTVAPNSAMHQARHNESTFGESVLRAGDGKR